MIEKLKEIILDYQKMSFETGAERQLELISLKGKASIYIGVRRSGKSTFLYQAMKHLRAEKVPHENILYINFFDDRLHLLKQQGLEVIIEAYFSLYPEKKGVEKIYCFFDEIQQIDNWEPFIDRIMRTEKCAVFITGSSAKMLSTDLATQMRGRSITWEVFPFSFLEFLDYKEFKFKKNITTKERHITENFFNDYWVSGSFPEVLDLNKNLRVKIHQNYFETLLYRDIIDRHDIPHPQAVKDLALWLIDNTASLYSVNRLTNYLKSIGHKITKTSVSNYIHWFEDAFMFFTVRIYNASLAKSNTNPKKIYCIDHSFVRSISSGILINSGHLLENLVYITLRRSTPNIFYYKTKKGYEVDFIAITNSTKQLVQVSESLVNETTKKREVRALQEAMSELSINYSIIVTKNEKELIQVDGGQIRVIPAWEFLTLIGAKSAH